LLVVHLPSHSPLCHISSAFPCCLFSTLYITVSANLHNVEL
jgi:hypothetical protein